MRFRASTKKQLLRHFIGGVAVFCVCIRYRIKNDRSSLDSRGDLIVNRYAVLQVFCMSSHYIKEEWL